MTSIEYIGRHNRVYTGVAMAFAVTALAGCGWGGGKKQEGISDCPKGYETSAVVYRQGNLITAFETAGQELASDYKLAKGERRIRLGVAFAQLFNESSRSTGIPHIGASDAPKHLTPDSYIADDPNEIMCTTEDANKQDLTVLSPNAMEAKAILGSVGIKVNLGNSVRS